MTDARSPGRQGRGTPRVTLAGVTIIAALALTLSGCARLAGRADPDPASGSAAQPGTASTPAPSATLGADIVTPRSVTPSPAPQLLGGGARPAATPPAAVSTTQADALLRAIDGALGTLDGAVSDAGSAIAEGE